MLVQRNRRRPPSIAGASLSVLWRITVFLTTLATSSRCRTCCYGFHLVGRSVVSRWNSQTKAQPSFARTSGASLQHGGIIRQPNRCNSHPVVPPHALLEHGRSRSSLRGYDRGSSRLFTTAPAAMDEQDDEKPTSKAESTTTSRSSARTTTTTMNPQKYQKQLTLDFVRIGGPALIQLAAEPLASLVDTAYLGRLGPEVLGGAGVAISAQYAVSKLYNDPLLRTSISLVAAQDGATRSTASTSSSSNGTTTDETVASAHQAKRDDLSIAVSSALLLAATIGIVQLFIYSIFCHGITRGMGLTPASPMWHSAITYLQVRAFGTPAATLWLVTNGIFRGLGDTQTPLWYSLCFTALNAILDPIFIFVFNWGASGAAAGTALAQYAALIPLLYALHRRVNIDIVHNLRQLGQSLQQYLKAGSLVLVRSLGKVLAYSVCARQAALLGSVAAAAYNLTFQLGFATTQICEAVAVAVQTLLAREMADTTTYPPRIRAQLIRHLITTSVGFGAAVATALSLSTYWRRHWILSGLTTNPSVQAASAAIFPAVLLTQVLKGMAYPVNGIIMGSMDWFFSMVTMWLSNGVCVGLIHWFGRAGHAVTLNQVWLSLAAFMGTQVVAGIIRYESKTGVWKALDPPQEG